MKILESKIFDVINSILSFVQNITDNIRKSSFLLSSIDFFIILSIIATYVVSTFGSTTLIGAVSFCVPVFVVFKVLITKGEKIELERCNFYLLLYLLICFISNFTSYLPDKSLYGFMKTIIYFVFYFALCQFLKNNKKYITIILFTLAVLLSGESIIGLLQSYIGVESISTWQDTSYVNPEDVLSRVYGTLQPYNPNLFGGYLIAGFSSILAMTVLYFQKKKILSGIIALICFFISALCIFQTGCRGAYVALFIVVLGIVSASYQIIFKNYVNENLKKLWKSLISLGTIGSIGFMLLNHGIWQRLMSIFILRGDSSTSFRMNVYDSAIHMFQDNPIYGVGVGNKVFREIYGLYMLSGFDALSCYCIYLEMAVESGIFALITYLLFAFTLIFSGVKAFLNSKDLTYKVLVFVPLISIIAVLFHGFVDTVYFRPQIQYVFWTMAAILTVLTREEKTAE